MTAVDLKARFNSNDFLFYVLSSVAGFVAYNKLIKWAFFHFDSLKNNPRFWRFKNTFVSWTHALISSILVTINILTIPEQFKDMINSGTHLSYSILCISIGYFIYDTLDIILVHRKISSKSYVVLFHHIFIILIFCIPMVEKRFVSHGVVSLSLEFNTVFLHMRFMAIFLNVDKSSLQFKIISALNFLSFLLFRIGALFLLAALLKGSVGYVTPNWIILGAVSLILMMIINIIYLKRLVQSDLRSIKESTSANGVASEKID